MLYSTLSMFSHCVHSSWKLLGYNMMNHFAFMQFGETALVKATWRGWIDICQMLIDAGIDVNAQDIVSCYYNIILYTCATIRTEWLTFCSQRNGCLNLILDRRNCITQCSSNRKLGGGESTSSRRS